MRQHRVVHISGFTGRGQFVAQIWNLPYRRIAFCAASAQSEAVSSADALPIPNRRNGRLKICYEQTSASNR